MIRSFRFLYLTFCWSFPEFLVGLTAFRMWGRQSLLTKALLLQWLLWFASPPALASSLTPQHVSTTLFNTTTTTATPSNNSKCVWKQLGEKNFADNPTHITVKAARDPANISLIFVANDNTGGTYEGTLHEEVINSTPRNVSLYSDKSGIGLLGIKFYALSQGKTYSDSLMGELTFSHFKVVGDLLEWSWLCRAEGGQTSQETSITSTTHGDVTGTSATTTTSTKHDDHFSTSTTTTTHEGISSVNADTIIQINSDQDTMGRIYQSEELPDTTQVIWDLFTVVRTYQSGELPDTTQDITQITNPVTSETAATTGRSPEIRLGYSSSLSTGFPTTDATTTVVVDEDARKSRDSAEKVNENPDESQDSSNGITSALSTIAVVIVVFIIIVIYKMYKRQEKTGHLNFEVHENEIVEAGDVGRERGASGRPEADDCV